MILAGPPLPERPANLDEAIDRGYAPHPDDLLPGPPLDAQWQAALEGANTSARHRRDLEREDDRCGDRCLGCDERMCAIDGPEPRACGTTCADCSCDCQTCVHVREDMRADLLHTIEREAS